MAAKRITNEDGKHTSTTAIPDTGADSTYVINIDLLDNITNPATEQVIVADGSAHTIEALGTLLGHPSVFTWASFMLIMFSFTKKRGVSPIIDEGST